jgi:hypothetical protein
MAIDPLSDQLAKITRLTDPFNSAALAVRALSPLRQDYSELLKPPKDYKLADTLAKDVIQEFREFEATLTADQEVAVMLASFGVAVLIHVARVRWRNPNMVILDGFDGEGKPVTLCQHMAQFSVLLRAVAPLPGQQARRIGFAVEDAAKPLDEG